MICLCFIDAEKSYTEGSKAPQCVKTGSCASNNNASNGNGSGNSNTGSGSNGNGSKENSSTSNKSLGVTLLFSLIMCIIV